VRPAIMDASCEGDIHEWSPFRALWFAEQLHPGLVGESVSIARVTRDARANDVLPSSLSAAISGKHVIEVQLWAIENSSAVLAGIFIPFEDIETGELDLFFWKTLEKTKHNDTRQSDTKRDGLEHPWLRIFHREVTPT